MPKTPQEDLLELIASNNINAVSKILDKNPLLINGDIRGKTPLMRAAIHSKGADMIRLLVKRGAKRNTQNAFVNNTTALMNAAGNGFFDNVLALVEPNPGNDPAINTKAANGKTALMYSLDPEITALLLDVGADPRITNNDGKTALDLATSDTIRNVLLAKDALARASIVDILPKTLYRTATKVLKKGAFGEVSRTNRNGTAVAVKRILFDEKARKGPDNIEKSDPSDFVHEIDGLQKVANSNYALKYINSDKSAVNGYIVTELLSGTDLYDAIESRTINDSNIVQIVTDSLKGLDELHKRHVLHLDIKPENMWVYPENKEKTIKYIDFGLWCDMDSCARVEIRGTDGYSRPINQTMFIASYDKTSDFYGLGRSLVDILVGFPQTVKQDAYCKYVFDSIQQNKPWTADGAYFTPALGSEMQTWLANVIYKLLNLTNEQNAMDAFPMVGGQWLSRNNSVQKVYRMPSKTRSARLQRSKSKKQSRSRSQSGGYGLAYLRNEEGLNIYRLLYAGKEQARREALKASGKKPGAGDPCTPKFGPFSECEGYPKLKCTERRWESPDRDKSWGPMYENRCMGEGTKFFTNYNEGHFYYPPYYEYDDAVQAELKERGY